MTFSPAHTGDVRKERRIVRGLTTAAATLLAFASASGASGDTGVTIDYSPYARVLSAFVDEHGLVDYVGLASNRTDLDTFVHILARLDPPTTSRWSKAQQMAMWINAYNALTLKAVVDHYPVESIKDIGSVFRSVWDKLKFDVMGRKVTLNDIEHEILRKQFTDPRIHLAVNCASMGCPRLARQPFRAETLDEQFAEQAEHFLSNPSAFRIQKNSNTVYLSPIFKWFGADFVPRYGSRTTRQGVDARENAALNFAATHVPEGDRAYLEKAHVKVKYLGYDWSLNTQ